MQEKCEKCGKQLCPRISKLGNHMTDEKGMDEECHGICNPKTIEDIRFVHDYFELTYANYLVIPRCILQSMPDRWQVKIVRLLDELDEAFDWRRKGVMVRLVDKDGWQIERDDFNAYERGRRTLTHDEAQTLTERHNKLHDKGVPESSRTKEDILAFNNGAEYGARSMLESILSDVEENEKKMEDFESHEYKVGFKNAIARIKKNILETEIDDVIRDE